MDNIVYSATERVLYYPQLYPSKCWTCEHARDIEEKFLVRGWCGCNKLDYRSGFTEFPNCEDHKQGWIYGRRPCLSFPQSLPNTSYNFMGIVKGVTSCPLYKEHKK